MEFGKAEMESWGLRTRDLANLQFNTQQQEAHSPQLQWQPQECSTGPFPLGVTSPHAVNPRLSLWMLGNGRSQGHKWFCPDFAPSAIVGAGLHLPSTLLPLGSISAHFSAVIPARCTERGSEAIPGLCSSCNWEKLQNIDVHSWRHTPIYIHARKPQSSCCKGDTAERQVLGRPPPPQTSANPQHASVLPPQPFRNPHPTSRILPTSRAPIARRSISPTASPPSQ